MDIILSIMLKTPEKFIRDLSERAKARRLALTFTQMELSKRSGVSLGTLKLFERTGKISLDSLLKLAIALGSTQGFDVLFTYSKSSLSPVSLDDLIKTSTPRKRGRSA
jgi:transcriptional regulator with XRE-family HTH domain